MHCRSIVAAWVAFTICILSAGSATAQDGDVAAAAAAFQRAQQAQLAGEYARAGELFELAFDAAASQAALRSAIRNYVAAQDFARATTLSVRALVRYPGEAETRQLAQETLDAHQGTLGHVRVQCTEACTLIVDGAVEEAREAERHEFFLAPGEHSVAADFDGRRSEALTVTAVAGEAADERFEAPPAPEPEQVAPPVDTTPEPEPRTPPPPPAPRGLSPVYFWTGAGLTVALGGVAIWSLVDTLDARDAYEANPTEQGYHRGRDKERRLYAFTGAVATVGVATLLVGVLGTRWSDGESNLARFDLRLGPEGGALTLRGSF